jgi:Cd2+/Zn2+-exporting ATPase
VTASAVWRAARGDDRARHAITGLLSLAPDSAEVRHDDGHWQRVPSATVRPGQVMRVRPGARIAADATVTTGRTTVDESAVTGESLPVDKEAGDPLYAGTVNLSGTVEATVTAAADQTLLARIIEAVEQAQGARAPTQAFVDRFAAIYTPAVFGFALAVAVLGPWLMGWSWAQGIYKALVLLVIACPCALVISTPVTIVSGLAAAARRGVLIKGGVHLERARRLRIVALDKTGTITEGRPRLVATELLATDLARDEVLHWAADLAAHSDHPVSRAIAQGLAGAGCAQDLDAFEALPGQGTRARAHGADLWLGNHRLIESLGLCSPALEATLARHEAQGRTVSVLANRQRVLAIFAVADAVRPTSREAMVQLAALGVRTLILSGDNDATVATIAREAAVADAQGNLLPQDKLDIVRQLQGEGRHHVAMVGDGINDAPALASADLGIAMGGAGTDIAIEAADVVIMNDDLRRIPETIALSRRTHAILVQNMALALGIKAVFLGLAVAGSATMWMAVFADMGASLIVVANGLRLLRSPRGPRVLNPT